MPLLLIRQQVGSVGNPDGGDVGPAFQVRTKVTTGRGRMAISNLLFVLKVLFFFLCEPFLKSSLNLLHCFCFMFSFLATSHLGS